MKRSEIGAILTGVLVIGLALFFIIHVLVPMRKETDKQLVELEKEIDKLGLEIDQLNQGVWNNERDLTYLDVQLWILEIEIMNQPFYFSPAGPLNFSPENTWEKQLKAWNFWFDHTILKDESIPFGVQNKNIPSGV